MRTAECLNTSESSPKCFQLSLSLNRAAQNPSLLTPSPPLFTLPLFLGFSSFMTFTLPPPPTTVLELTVISAEGLNNYTSFFNPTIKPFFTLTKLPPTLTQTSSLDHKFRVPLDPTFFSDPFSCLHLQLFTKRRILGLAQLGWCLIPASDIAMLPPGSVRYLSYRLRGRDGCRGHAIINISIRLEGHGHGHPWMSTSLSPTMDTCHTVIGIPVTAIRETDDGDCSSNNTRIMR